MDDTLVDKHRGYPPLPIERKTGAEPFRRGEQPIGLTLLDFWQWSGSDLIGNTARGVLAEYIVASALGLASQVRNDWEECDLRLPPDIKIEVKSAAYLQSWFHRDLSKIVFSVRPARKWSKETGQLSSEAKRHADVYIFCLLDHKEKASLNPLNLDQWKFYVLPTTRVDQWDRTAKSIGLSTLLMLEPRVVTYEHLADCIKQLAAENHR